MRDVEALKMGVGRFLHAERVRLYGDMGNIAGGAIALIGAAINVIAWLAKHGGWQSSLARHYDDILVFTSLLTVLAAAVVVFRVLKTVHNEAKVTAKVRSYFQTFADVNACCDKAIFERMNTVLVDGADVLHAVDLVMADIRANIEFLLLTVCNVLGAQTRATCAACVKVIRVWGTGDDQLAGAKLQIAVRDPYSATKRKVNDHKLYSIDANTATLRILGEGAQVYVEDNLPRAERENLYSNAREKWKQDYRATIAVPLPRFDTTHVGVSGGLFADSMAGGFNNDTCIHYMQELRWRLAVMLYREERLTTIASKLKAHKDGTPE